MLKAACLLICLTPLFAKSQGNNSKTHPLVTQDWTIIKAVDITDTTHVVYDPPRKITSWDMSNVFIYSLGKGQVGLANSLGVDIGVLDSITPGRFLVNISYPGGEKSVFEYSQVKITKNQITFAFRRWNMVNNGKDRLFQYGYYATCKPGKRTDPKPTLAEIEKKRGNRIDFVFTTEDGKPLQDKKVEITAVVKGYQVLSALYTDSLGKATGYYPDYYFEINHTINLLIRQENLRSSVLLEKKYCPATVKRVLSASGETGSKFEQPPD